MYPYGNTNPGLNAGSSNSNAIHGMSYYGQVPNQQMQQQYYPRHQQQQQFNHGGQMSFPGQFQNLATQPRQRLPFPQQQNSVEDKQKQYKLEQQRKFKNFGKSFTNTSIDSMLSNIVGSSEKSKSVTKNVAKKEEQDDFGDFLEATPTPQTAPPSSTPPVVLASSSTTASLPVRQLAHASADSDRSASKTHSHSYSSSISHPKLKPEIDLQAKMMSSLDLNKSQHAYMKFKPVTVHQGKRPEAKAYQPSTKAANWSSLTSVENAFIVEKPAEAPAAAVPVPPQDNLPKQQSTTEGFWTFDLANAPLLYKHVHEASIADDGLTDTSKLYPILLQCNLSKQTLGKLWAIANQTVPGRLKQNELFTLLALIALAQNGQKNLDIKSVLSLPAPPIPYMSAYQNAEASKPIQHIEPAPQSNATTNHSNVSKEEDNFDDFQEFQSVSTTLTPPVVDLLGETSSVELPPTSGNSTFISKEVLSSRIQISPLPSKQNKTLGIETNLNHSSPTLQLGLSHEQQATNAASITNNWSDFKALEKAEGTSALKPNSALNQPDKYAAFSGLSQEVDLFQGFESTTPSNAPASQSEHFPNLAPPAYSSMFEDNSSIEHGMSNSVSIAMKEDGPPSSDFSDFSNFVSSTSQDNSVENQEFKSSIFEDRSSDRKNPLFSDFNSSSAFAPSTSKESNLPSIDFNAFSSASCVSKEKNPSKSELKSSTEDVLDWSLSKNSATTGQNLDGSNLTSLQRNVNESPLTIKSSLFKDVLSNSVTGNDTLSIQSDTNSVKSLELHSLSQTISQQSLGTINPVPGVQSQPSSTSVNAPAPKKRYGPSFCDDDYNDFAEPPPDLPPDTFGEFDACEEGNSTLNDFDAFASYVTPQKMQHKPSLVVANTSESDLTQPAGNNDEMLATSPISLPITPDINGLTSVEDNCVISYGDSKLDTVLSDDDVKKEDATSSEEIIKAEDVKKDTVSNSVSPPRSATSKYENIEFSSDDWKITPTHSDQTELYAEKWEKCLSAGNEIISKANQILGSIQSPDLCNEVVYSVKGQRFISDLSEVHAVAQRLCCSIRKLSMKNESLQHLHKQIELAWHNLLAFCPNTTIAEPVTDPTNEDGICGICLTGLNTLSISYAGSDYHATCANFWVNCVESVLPALQLPAEKTR